LQEKMAQWWDRLACWLP